MYDWVQCDACRAIMNAVFDCSVDAEKGITAETYDERATEHEGDDTHGEAARAYLARGPRPCSPSTPPHRPSMSESKQIYSGHPDNFEELRSAQNRELLGKLGEGIDEMKRVNRESRCSELPDLQRTSNVQVLTCVQDSSPDRRGLPRTSTTQLLAYAEIPAPPLGRAIPVLQRWPADAFGPGAAGR